MPVLDARGLYVTPGFIDIHSHSDFTLLADPRAVSSVTQGVTFEVVGNCGHGCAPVRDPLLAAANIYGYEPTLGIHWRTMAGYLQAVEEARPAVNVASLVPNGNLRLGVAGLVDRPSTPEELAEMRRLLEQSIEEGAIGYSTGLEYGLERGCTEEEIQALCRTTANSGGFYATHTRNLDGQPQQAIAEPIRAARATGVSLQISHISVVARLTDRSREAVEQALIQVEEARRQGVDVYFDMHTRLFGTTNLSAALPAWAVEGGKLATERRLRDSAERRRMRQHPNIIAALARGDWSRIVIFDSKAQPEVARRSVAELSAERGTDAFDTIYDLLLGEMDDLHGLMVIAYAYREDDIRPAFQHPLCMIGSDATALSPDGILGGKSFHGAYTWAGWFWRHFVREERLLPPAEAIRRLTSLPAGRLRLADRGILRQGAFADMAIFDPGLFGERGTTFEPNQPAAGMVHVLVNGVLTMKDGRLTGAHGGRVIRS